MFDWLFVRWKANQVFAAMTGTGSCLWRHEWGRWEAVGTGKITRRSVTSVDDAYIGDYVDMKRTCQRCGLIKLRTVKSKL